MLHKVEIHSGLWLGWDWAATSGGWIVEPASASVLPIEQCLADVRDDPAPCDCELRQLQDSGSTTVV